MVYAHQKEIQELRKEIREKDIQLDELTQNSEVQMQVQVFTVTVCICTLSAFILMACFSC